MFRRVLFLFRSSILRLAEALGLSRFMGYTCQATKWGTRWLKQPRPGTRTNGVQMQGNSSQPSLFDQIQGSRPQRSNASVLQGRETGTQEFPMREKASSKRNCEACRNRTLEQTCITAAIRRCPLSNSLGTLATTNCLKRGSHCNHCKLEATELRRVRKLVKPAFGKGHGRKLYGISFEDYDAKVKTAAWGVLLHLRHE